MIKRRSFLRKNFMNPKMIENPNQFISPSKDENGLSSGIIFISLISIFSFKERSGQIYSKNKKERGGQ
jgi:hypothetical protein